MDGGGSRPALENTRNQAHDSDRERGEQELPAGRRAQFSRAAANQAHPAEKKNGGQKAVNTLCSGKCLKQKNLAEQLRLFGDDARSRPSGGLYAGGGADAGEDSAQRAPPAKYQ